MHSLTKSFIRKRDTEMLHLHAPGPVKEHHEAPVRERSLSESFMFAGYFPDASYRDIAPRLTFLFFHLTIMMAALKQQ
jgi:hypothetical protein